MRKKSWGEYNKSISDKIIEWFRYKNVLQYLPEAEKLLDIGCGYYGELLYYLINKSKVNKAYGIDLSVSPDNKKGVKLVEGNVEEKFNFPDGLFGVETCMALIEHLNNPRKMLKEAHRTLKKEGTLIVTTPNKKWKGPLELSAKLGLVSDEEINDHKRYYTKDSLKTNLIKAGFKGKNIEITTYPLKGILDFVLFAVAKK